MSNENKNESNAPILPVSDQKMEYQLDLHPNSKQCYSEHNQLEINIQLFENIQLKNLINQFEDILNRVKQLQLKYLLQPVQIATFKLKELQKITEVLACDYYEDRPCCNKNCCNELDLTKIVNDSEKKQRSNDGFNESCECLNMHCEKSCHCSSNEGELDQNKKIITAVQSAENCCEKKTSSGIKCNPCRCSYDASGKKVKTLECKLASRAKKIKRNEAEMLALNDAVKLKKDETKLPLTSRRSTANILTERMISNSKLEIQTNLTNFKLNFKKENTAIQDITYQNVRERNQAISCNLSSESSSEEYYSDSSSDQISYSKHTAPLRSPRWPTKESNDKKMHSKVECCGCGQRVETIKVGENETCPCGCGDVETLPEGKYVDRCESCGVAIADSSLSRNKRLGTEKGCDASDNDSAMKKQHQDFCLFALSRYENFFSSAFAVDVIGLKYVEALEDKYFGNEKVIAEQRKLLSTKNNHDIFTPVPAYKLSKLCICKQYL